MEGVIISDVIRKHRERAGLSQAALARLVGVSQPTIADLESGRQTTSKHLPQIAEALGVPMGEIDPNYRSALPPSPPRDKEPVHKRVRQPFDNRDPVPVYASAEGGDGAMVLTTEPVDWEPRPHTLEGAKDAYMMIVSGESMVPAYKPGERVWVDPRLGLIRDEPAIFYAVHHEDGDERVIIKEFVRQTAGQWIVRQFNPVQEITLDKSEWNKAHRVIGKFTRR